MKSLLNNNIWMWVVLDHRSYFRAKILNDARHLSNAHHAIDLMMAQILNNSVNFHADCIISEEKVVPQQDSCQANYKMVVIDYFFHRYSNLWTGRQRYFLEWLCRFLNLKHNTFLVSGLENDSLEDNTKIYQRVEPTNYGTL